MPDGRLVLSVWQWEGSDWDVVTPAATPLPRYGPAMAWDSGRQRAVLFGGSAEIAESCWGRATDLCRDTWEWDGHAWSRRTPDTIPGVRYLAAMAHHAGVGRTVLFGGCVGPAVGDATEPSPCGWIAEDSWTWDGEDWHEAAAGPPPRFAHAMAYDARRARVVLFGGMAAEECGVAETNVCSDTWEWDGASWEQREPATSPPPSRAPALAYDAARGEVVLVTGPSGADEDLASTWTWDGLEWTRLAPAIAASGRQAHDLVYDPSRGETLLFGGAGNGDGTCRARETRDRSTRCRLTWGYAPARAVPHLVAGFDLRTTGTTEPSSADRSTKTVLGVTVRSRAGGVGHTWGSGRADGQPVTGWSLAVAALGRGGWLRLHESAAPPGAPEEWAETFGPDWTCGEPWCGDGTIDRWPAADGRLYLDLAPRAPQGASPERAEVVLDYLELTVRTWRTGCEAPGGPDAEGTPDGTPCLDGRPETAGERCRGRSCEVPP